MDFPPVSNLISLTFNELNNKGVSQSAEVPARGPRAVADAAGMGGDVAGADAGRSSLWDDGALGRQFEAWA